METRTITIEFLSPAFPGDAQQNAAWRTPPFKAQLRQWWRVVMAARGLTLADIRLQEGQLFGEAAGNSGRQSRVRLRLRGPRAWKLGTLREWVSKDSRQRMASGSGRRMFAGDVYLGYGPLQPKGAVLSASAAIASGESGELRLAWPRQEPGADGIDPALGLMHRLGTVGGRSRNGWGSYALVAGAPTVDLAAYRVDWREAIGREWVHGIGADDRGLLLWWTPAEGSWEALVGRLARLRAELCSEAGPLRPLMSYPVTKRSQPGWDQAARVPNTLRFKVVRDGHGKLRAQVAHLPCRPEWRLWKELSPTQQREFTHLWRQAHELLDEQLERVAS
ncbi:hypothetical protein [Aquisalimonas sp.]|uniref:hypothetical protein n=1 Tax=Aquisalimonas sp. TaxID=1872621 RepID=UPI0025C2D0F6|nr:hypothetical protein [Aquisalimonas sp.]